MIPLRLRLRNFLSYGENAAALSFDGIHLACLCGDNGHGKSALLDAITWALWGRARTSDRRDVSDDDLIHLGKNEMEVEFQFGLDDERYLVLRKRSIRITPRRRTGSTVLEFQVSNGDGEYRPLTGDSLQATQRKINEVLRMDYDSFINSAFLLQGRADEFTRKTPGERKRILSELLGLSIYDQLEELARENARRCESERRESEIAIAEIDGQLAREPEYRSELDLVLKRIEDLGKAIRGLERRVSALRESRQELETKRRERVDVLARMDREEQALRSISSQMDRHRRQLEEQEKIVARAAEIRGDYAELMAKRDELGQMDGQLDRLLTLNEQKNHLERTIAEARGHLVSELRVLESQIGKLKQQVDAIPSRRAEKAEAESQLTGLAELELERDEVRDRIQACRNQMEILKNSNARLREEMSQAREKLDLLAGTSAACPICESELDEAGRERLRGRYADDGRRMGDEYRSNVAKAKEIEGEVEEAQRRLTQIGQRIQQRGAIERRLVASERGLADAQEAKAQLTTVATQYSDLARRIEDKRYAEAEQERLEGLLAAIAVVGYDAARHQATRERCSRLAPNEELKARLALAEARLPEERDAIEQLGQIAAEQRTSLEADRNRADELERELVELPGVEEGLRRAEAELDGLIAQQNRAQREQGRAQQLLNHCEYLRQQRLSRQTAMIKAADQKAIYDDLTLAFGKKGIQAMIIEGAIPEIEQEANALLTRMTDNRLHVTFETQRDARAGDGVIETLDIKIADDLGVRRLELYSGGEAFRINFAIRIALSKLLARRAGARLQTLVIDEGFGTQDSFGRQRLVEAINSIVDDFERIIVITHIDELKDAFPTRIEVVKGPEGSQVTVQ